MTTHCQCLMARGTSHQMAWIPTEFATDGRLVDLKRGGQWDRGWKVVTAGKAQLDSTFVRERGADYKNMRKMTDI